MTFGAAVDDHAVGWRSAWNKTVATRAMAGTVFDIPRKSSRSRPFISADAASDMTGRESVLTATALDARGVSEVSWQGHTCNAAVAKVVPYRPRRQVRKSSQGRIEQPTSKRRGSRGAGLEAV